MCRRPSASHARAAPHRQNLSAFAQSPAAALSRGFPRVARGVRELRLYRSLCSVRFRWCAPVFARVWDCGCERNRRAQSRSLIGFGCAACRPLDYTNTISLTMRLPSVAKARLPSSSDAATTLYLAHGSQGNSFAAAFDPDFERWTAGGDRGIVAYARSHLLDISMGFFDPLCSDSELPTVLDEFISARSPEAFWKVSAPVARALAARGDWYIAPYGLEHNVWAKPSHGISLAGQQRRGLRREIAAATRGGLRVEIIDGDDDDEGSGSSSSGSGGSGGSGSSGGSSGTWAELESVSARWLRTRTRRYEIRRATRRTPHRHERYCTKMICRSPTGRAVGWAAFDHLYRQGELIGVGLNAVRWDGSARGAAALLAWRGAEMVREAHGAAERPFVLCLGESPFGACELTASDPASRG